MYKKIFRKNYFEVFADKEIQDHMIYLCRLIKETRYQEPQSQHLYLLEIYYLRLIKDIYYTLYKMIQS